MSASPRTREAAPDLEPGSALDRYVIEGLLGRGGMGSVYRAFDTRLERSVAIKILAARDGDESVASALHEARASAAIHHPWVAEVFDAGCAGETAFIVMELVRGTSLRRLVGDPSIEVALKVRWLAHVAVALAYTHRLGVIHRDVKPENVIVRDDGVIKVLDFGIARLPPVGGGASTPRPTLSRSGAILGTPAYMAPEHARGHEIDGRADQFAWGVLAYELLTGFMPWHRAAGPLGLLAAVLCDEPEPVDLTAGIPDEVVAVVMRALSKSRDDRFPSMSDVAEALAPHAAPGLPPPSSPPERPSSSPLADSALISVELSPVSAEPTSRAPPRSGERPSPPRFRPDLPVPPVLPPRARESAPPLWGRGPLPIFKEPDFAAPIDLRAHLARLPRGATCKGMFFSELLDLGAAARVDLAAVALVPERRYLPFNDYPVRDWMALAMAAAAALHPRVSRGEGLRRLGWTALETVLGSRMGKTVLGMFGKDVEMLLTHGAKVYPRMLNFGRFGSEKIAPGTFVLRADDMPLFLETWHVGVIESVFRYTGARGTVRIAAHGITAATYEVKLR